MGTAWVRHETGRETGTEKIISGYFYHPRAGNSTPDAMGHVQDPKNPTKNSKNVENMFNKDVEKCRKWAEMGREK